MDVTFNSRNVRKRNYDICANRRLKSSSVSAKSDQTLHCPHEDIKLSKMRPVKILISLRECAGWSESSPSANVQRYVSRRCASFNSDFKSAGYCGRLTVLVVDVLMTDNYILWRLQRFCAVCAVRVSFLIELITVILIICTLEVSAIEKQITSSEMKTCVKQLFPHENTPI